MGFHKSATLKEFVQSDIDFSFLIFSFRNDFIIFIRTRSISLPWCLTDTLYTVTSETMDGCAGNVRCNRPSHFQNIGQYCVHVHIGCCHVLCNWALLMRSTQYDVKKCSTKDRQLNSIKNHSSCEWHLNCAREDWSMAQLKSMGSEENTSD